MPDALVNTAVMGSTDPPPPVTAKVTATPGTGLLLTSPTMIEGGVETAVPTGALCPSPAWIAISVGTPAVMVTTEEITGVSPLLVNSSVRGPTVPVIDNPENVARPAASVFTVVAPPRTPPPELIRTLTDRTPATGSPDTSCT